MLIIAPINVDAASASISTTTNATTITLGNTVTVYVKVSSGSKIGSWNMMLSYDTSMLQLTSSTSENGGVNMANSSSGVYSKNYTFTFKTLKTGSTSLRVNSYQVVDFDSVSDMSVSSYGTDITIKTYQEIIDSYSKDNNLKGLSVEGFELKEPFDMNTLEYSVEVPEGTNEIIVHADKNDYRSTVEGAGTLAVTPGINEFEILVRSQSGAEKIYKLSVNVIDQNPIDVKTDLGDMTVVKLKEQLEIPTGYVEETVTMGEFEIPAFYNEELDYTLVGLKDTKGKVNLYIYDKENNSYELYIEFKFNGMIVTPIKSDKPLEGYTKYTEEIFGVETEVYKVNSKSNFWIFYGKNILTGEEAFYTYDSKNESSILYDSEMIEKLNEKNTLYMYMIFGLSGLFIIMFIIIIALMSKNSKRRKQIKSIMNSEKNIVDNKLNETKKTENKEETTKQKTIKIPEIKEGPKEEFENILDDKKTKKKNKDKKVERTTRE